MPGDIEVDDAPTVVTDDEEAVQEVEGEGGNGEEVHGRDGFAMIMKKCPPTLGGFRISGCASHPAGDGSFGNLKAERGVRHECEEHPGLRSQRPSGKSNHELLSESSCRQLACALCRAWPNTGGIPPGASGAQCQE